MSKLTQLKLHASTVCSEKNIGNEYRVRRLKQTTNYGQGFAYFRWQFLKNERENALNHNRYDKYAKRLMPEIAI